MIIAARGIYIGGLPYDITRQGVVEVVKQFGPVRRFTDTVQIRRHEARFFSSIQVFRASSSSNYYLPDSILRVFFRTVSAVGS